MRSPSSAPAGYDSARRSQQRELAIAADGSFVETTNRKAAEALAAHYAKQEGEQYKVFSRQEGSRVIYRVRPRSVPSVSATPSSSEGLYSAADSALTSPSSPDVSPVVHALRQAVPRSSSERAHGTPGDPTGVKYGRSNDSGASSFVKGSRSQGDVLGRMLGWDAGSQRREAGTARLGLPDFLTGDGARSLKTSDGSDGSDDHDSSDLPTDPVVDALSQARPEPVARPSLARTTSSPFGIGVRVPAAASSPMPSTANANLHTTTSHLQQPRTMREVASSDSIRTARADDDQNPPPLPPSRWHDTRIFDVMQAAGSAHPPSSPPIASSSMGLAHARLPSTSSISSLASSTSQTSSAHHITVSFTTTPGDDPRFVIWGTAARAASSRASSTAGDRRGSHAGLGDYEVGSPATSASGSPASKRWSGFKERGSRESSSPASSVRDSLGSNDPVSPLQPSSLAQSHQRVLMAATPERWIAELTSQISSDLLSTFFLTYRSFLTPIDLLHLLITRFEWAMQSPQSPADEASRRIVRVRTFVVIQHWLLNHFVDDFYPNRDVRRGLTEWLNDAARSPRFRDSPKDMRLIKGLKKVCRKLKEVHTVVGTSDLGSARRAMDDADLDVSSPKLGISDEEVDLDLGRYDSSTFATTSTAPPLTTPAQPRGRLASFLSAQSSPHDVTPSASASHPTATLPLPSSNDNPLTRTFSNALGSFGRFKRMLGNRSGGEGHGDAHGLNTEAMDEVEFERSETGDLLWITGGLERYLEYHGIAIESDEDGRPNDQPAADQHQPDRPETGSPASLDAPPTTARAAIEERQEPQSPTSASTSIGLGLGMQEPCNELETPHNTLRPGLPAAEAPAPPATLPIFEPSPFVEDDSSRFDVGPDAYFLPVAGRPASRRIELDDIDLSDEDEDVVEVKRTLKRLPATGNLRYESKATVTADTHFRQARPHSIDSVSSYGFPQPQTYVQHGRDTLSPSGESASFVDDEEGIEPNAGVQIVAGFILEGIDDSDEEEGEQGGIEAALRRLEGIVDDTREQERKKKVERQMARSARVLAGGTLATPARSQSGHGEADDEQSLSPSMAPSLPPVDSILADLPPAARDATAVAASLLQLSPPASPTKSQAPLPLQKSPPSSFARREGPGRKPSLAKLFGAHSTLRPRSTRPTGPHPNVGLSPPTHRSFLLVCRTETLARQFCLIERDLLRMLGWQELVSDSWQQSLKRGEGDVLDWEQYLKDQRRAELDDRDRKEKTGRGVEGLIARFNLTANWIGSEIVLTASPEERAALVAKLIRLAFKCFCQSNFQTLAQIMYGLQLPDVQRLAKTWARVPKYEMRTFKSMQALVSDSKNFKLLRDVTDNLILQYGPPGQRGLSPAFIEPSKSSAAAKGIKASPAPLGCIPFFGLFLRDLATNAELPTHLDPTSPHSPASTDSSGNLLEVTNPSAFTHLPPLPSHMPLRPLINVHKLRAQATLVQRVLAFQEFAEGYPYELESSVYFKCLKIRSLDPKVLHEVSCRLE